MMRSTLVLATWTLLAGAGIPLIGILNGGMTRAVGNPITAAAIMFVVAFVITFGVCLPTYGVSSFSHVASAPYSSYAAGLFIAFYVLSATIVIPYFGAGNFIAFILVAQLATAAVIDEFGFFGMAKQPAGALKLCGLLFIVGGIVLVQIASRQTRLS